MRKSLTRRLSLVSVGLMWLVGCAHEKAATTCTSCQQNRLTSAHTDSSSVRTVSVDSPVWTVVRHPSGLPGNYIRVQPGETATVKTASPYGATLPAVAKAPVEVPAVTTSLKPAVNPSPFSPAPLLPAKPISVEAKIPAQALATKVEPAVAEQPALVIPQPAAAVSVKSEIGANPNLKPGVREIVRDNVPKTYAHADDYTWVMGELEYQNTKKIWRVRFARYDENDKFGGSFTLVDCEDKMEKFQSGDMVKVDGFLVDSESRQASPDYKATDIVPLVTREVVDVKVEEKK